jgi:AbrB family looped-hinge helix DNA binding protein
MSIVKVTEKGQLTLPIDLRRKLRIGKNDRLTVEAEGDVLKLRKVRAQKLLGSNDPIWDFVGKGSSGTKDGSTDHDRHIAEGERQRWLKRSIERTVSAVFFYRF